MADLLLCLFKPIFAKHLVLNLFELIADFVQLLVREVLRVALVFRQFGVKCFDLVLELRRCLYSACSLLKHRLRLR